MATRKPGQGSKWIRKTTRLAIYLRDGMACVYCGAGAEDADLTLDHVRPCALGGQNVARNLVTCCKLCNDAKGALSLTLWNPHPDAVARVRRHVRRKLPREQARALLRAREEG